MQVEYKQNISELANYLDSGQLNRKRHWKKYQSSLGVARRTVQDDKDLEILNKIDSHFYDKWHVLKIRSSIGIPLLILAILIVQIFYIVTISQNLLFLFGLVFFFVFSLANFTLSHVIYHWLFGTALGIRFKSVFIFKSSFRKARYPFSLIGNLMPAFGIKYDTYSFLKASKWKRTVMFISSPLLTWIWFFINYLYLLTYFPSEMSFLILIGVFLVLLFVVNQVLSFYGKGDFWKASLDYRKY
ncbi:MAG: hypothetical protein ACFFAJ_05830 [Candidatus Hodarchaeota archaeon]